MAEFFCRVATDGGEVFERTYTAESENGLRRELDAQNLMLLNVRRSNPVLQQLAKSFRLRGNISGREFLLFNQELAALIKAGLPILNCLDILLDRRENQTLKQALIDIRERVQGGASLSEAFDAQGDIFPPLYSSSLASAERSGEMVSVLHRFISYQQKVLAIRQKVIAALIYPMILGVLLVGLIALMILFIIPMFNEFLSDFGKELPLITQVVMNTSMFAVQHWALILIATIASVIGFLVWKKTENGAMAMDKFNMRLPLVGKVIRNYAQNRFTRTLGTLVSGGIPLVNSLELAAHAVGSPVYEKALLTVAQHVKEGNSLWESLDDTELLTSITVQMIKVGESTGGLDEMLSNASEFTDNEIDNQLTRLMALIEPLMLVFMAIVVAVMLLSVYLPLIELNG
jgi:type IV pilus assembly protein PilC